MSVIDTLIYNRTLSDVERVYELKNKILQNGLSSLTDTERSEYFSGMKGAYNWTDFNRVGEAVNFIANRMKSLQGEIDTFRESLGLATSDVYNVPYDSSTITVFPKTDWTVYDTPTQSQVHTYLNNLITLRKQLSLPEYAPNVPETLDKLTIDTANSIEYLLHVIYEAFLAVEKTLYDKIEFTVANYTYAGIAYCGE